MSSTPPNPAPTPPLPPPRVPDHELIRRIGRGAYGEVWLARSVTGAFRAVKIVHRQSFDHDRPFEREFEGILKFEPISRRHDSQVDILHVGRGDDCFYYVMELADDQATGGQINPDHYTPRTLKSELLFHGRLPFEECVRIGLALTTALENLHGNGLAHRDVKPSNIIFVNGVPKLADIGLVTGIDATRSFVGTEGFAAPEGPGSPQADLYSLGKVLYEIATGKDRQEFPELPTQLREFPGREGLMELNAVIAGACRHDPKDRYPSATAMRLDLELLQSGKSLARLHRTQERLRFVSKAGAMVTGLALLILAGWFYQAHQTRNVRQLAQEKTHLAEAMTTLASENRERLIRLNVANGIREMDHGRIAPALGWLSEALALTTNNPADTAIQRIRIHQLLARQPRLLHLLPHPGAVPTAEFSPDERRVVTACVDGTIRIWDLAHDEKPVAEFRQERPLRQVRFTRDGQRLFVVQQNQLQRLTTVALLDAATGKPVFPPITDVTSCGLSPDDRWLAVARTNHLVQLIAAETGQVVVEAIGHEDRVETVGFSPDSTQLLTASRDHTVRRWDVATGKLIGPPLGHDQPVSRAIFNRDASRMATATFAESADGPIQFQTWDTATGVALGNPIGGLGLNSILAFDRSGRRLLTADREAMAKVWDADSHTAILPPLAMGSGSHALDFSPAGDSVAIGSEAGSTRVWDLETGSLLFPPLDNSGRTESVRFNGDGSRLLRASDAGTVMVWDLTQLPDDGSLSFQAFEKSAAAVSADGRHLLLGVVDMPAHLQLVDLEKFKASDLAIPFATAVGSPGGLIFDRAGNQWAADFGRPRELWVSRYETGEPSSAALWRREGGQIRYFKLPHADVGRGVFFSEAGSQVLTVSDDRITRIWNTADGSLQQAIRRPQADAAWLAVSPDLRTAVALLEDKKGWHMLLRDVQTGTALGPSAAQNPDINAATFSPDGTRVGTVGDNQCGRIWDARSGAPITPFFKHGGILLNLEWSPDGRRVLTAGRSPAVKVWDAATGKLALPPLVMKAKPVEHARFSADGRFIVAGSDEKLVRVWDAATGEAVTPFLPHSDNVTAAFVTAAQQLLTVSAQCVVRVWKLTETPYSAQELTDYARLLAGGALERSDTPGPSGPEEPAALLRSLRERQPKLFAAAPERLREWHRRAAQEPNSLVRAHAAIFHLEKLAQLAPADPTILEQLKRYRALLIPARDPATPPQLLDLTRAYTHSYDLRQQRELAELPRGRQKLAGTEFDLRGMVQLDHRSERADQVGPFHPSAIIPVGQRCRTLHFLQATEGDPRVNGSIVARWIIHYADGSTREWRVIYGEHVRDWTWWTKEEPLEAQQATLAWRGRAPVWNAPGTDGVRLFKASWTNPQPDVAIARLEFRIGETSLKPLVVAITAE